MSSVKRCLLVLYSATVLVMSGMDQYSSVHISPLSKSINEISVNGISTVNICQSEDPSLLLHGYDWLVRNAICQQENNALSISLPEYGYQPLFGLICTIMVKQLKALSLHNCYFSHVTNLSAQDYFAVRASGATKACLLFTQQAEPLEHLDIIAIDRTVVCANNVSTKNAKIFLSDNSECSMTGKTETQFIKLSPAAIYYAPDFVTQETIVNKGSSDESFALINQRRELIYSYYKEWDNLRRY